MSSATPGSNPRPDANPVSSASSSGSSAPARAAWDRASARGEPPVRVVVEQASRWGGWLNRLAWIGLGIALLVIVGMQATYSSYFSPNPEINEKYHSLSKLALDKVAIITVDGTIIHTEGFVKWQIDRVREDDAVKAIVLRVDSPGGTITGSHYIYHHLKKLAAAKEIPLVVSMGGIAASGGYYISMAVGDVPDTIFAEETTWTGSIGVIIPHYDLTGLMAKWDIADDSIVSHPLKQMGSPTKKLPPELREKEREILQRLVDDSFRDFKDIIKSGRPKFRQDEKALDALATGQIYTAKQAHALGLVDKLGFVEDAIDRVIELAKLDKENVRVVKYTKPKGLFDSPFGALGEEGKLDLAAMLDLTAPRAWYLCTWLPSVATNSAQ